MGTEWPPCSDQREGPEHGPGGARMRQKWVPKTQQE